MARTHQEILASLPATRQAKVAARADELRAEIDGLRALRLLAECTQEQIAEKLGVKQPSVHKIERQSDLYLSTLRRFVEAAGGTMELIVTLPGTGPMRLQGIGEISGSERG